MGIINVDSDATGLLLIIYSAFVKYWRKKWEYNEAVHQLFIDFKKAYVSVRKDVLYNILIEFGVPKKLVSADCSLHNKEHTRHFTTCCHIYTQFTTT